MNYCIIQLRVTGDEYMHVKKILTLLGILTIVVMGSACGTDRFADDIRVNVENETLRPLAGLTESVPSSVTVSEAPHPIPLRSTAVIPLTPTLPTGWRLTPSKNIQIEFTKTATPIITQYPGDHALFISQSPADGVVLQRNETFLIRWTLQNDGTNYWDSNYELRFIGGVPVTERDQIKSTDTKPGQTGDFYIWATTPGEPGNYVTRWNLLNSQGEFMAAVYLKFIVRD